MKYFAYGSNMDCKRMLARGIEFKDRVPGKVKDVKLVFNKSAAYNSSNGYANIQLQKGSFVEGVLYTIRKSDIRKLDFYEGYPLHYEKWEVMVKLETGEIIKAITYIAVPNKTRKGLKPSKDYLDHLLAGKYFLSDDYYNRLKATQTAEDDKYEMFPKSNKILRKTV